MFLKAWQLHPKACKIEKAEKTCLGLANKGGVQWCGPYTNANKSGFWLYSPIEIDFTFDGGKFEIHNMEDYGPEDYEKIKNLIRPSDESKIEKWCFPGFGRTKTTIGFVEKNVIQIWTGLILKTPPGWCLHIKNPNNFPRREIEIMEAVLETDWMQYDIWVNVSCSKGRVKINKELPLAQLVPMRRESFKADWELSRQEINRDDQESESVFKYWVDYNKQKFEMGGNQPLNEVLKKDSTTYFRERSRILGKEMEASSDLACPYKKSESNNSKCPYRKTLEEEMEEFKNSKPTVEFFPVFDKDKSEELRIIAQA